MPIITWSDEYALGNKLIDDQHKKLFNILNKLYDGFLAGDADLSYRIAVDRLWSIATYHFFTEEQLMQESGHHNFREHEQEHKLFIQKTYELKSTIIADNRDHARKLLEYLCDWIIRHEIVLDSKLLFPSSVRPENKQGSESGCHESLPQPNFLRRLKHGQKLSDRTAADSGPERADLRV